MTDIEVELLPRGSEHRLTDVAEDVFDGPLLADRVTEFTKDPRHHIVVATAGGDVVGFASAVHYVHPDKPPELWINEVGVAGAFRRQGVAGRMLDLLLDHGKKLGCVSAWVLTENDNQAAIGLYERSGGRRLVPDPVMFEFPLDESP